MSQGGTLQQIPIVGTFQQIKAGLGFGPARPESKLDATTDAIAGLINTFAGQTGQKLNRASREWATLVEAMEDGITCAPLAQLIIAR